MWIYLLHLASPLGSDRKIAQHYIGSALDVTARLATHRAGRGARMLAAAALRGIAFEVVRIWPGDRTLERRLKQYGHACDLCPTCSGASCWRRGVFAPEPEQLVLDLVEPMPDAPAGLRPDHYEYLIQRAWRQAIPPARIDLAAFDML